jgi:hypothetical protein
VASRQDRRLAPSVQMKIRASFDKLGLCSTCGA